jgi:hypothetical protein
MIVQPYEHQGLIVTPRGRGMGHVFGPLPPSVRSFRHHFGAARPGGGTGADFSSYVDHIRDQGQIGKCVGMAQARDVHVAAQKQLYSQPNPSAVPYPSEDGIYALAREEELTGPDDPISDTGSVPGLALQALQGDIGVPLERDWVANVGSVGDPANVGVKCPAEVLAAALTVKVSECYEVDTDPGAGRRDALVQVFDAGHVMSMAFPVGDEYESCNSEAPVMPVAGTIYGGHDVSLLGYKVVSGRVLFLSCGSWGTSFGFGGWTWFDESVITDPRTGDFVVMMVMPNFSATKKE